MSNTAPVEKAQSSDASQATIAARLFDQHEACLWNLRQHEVDVLLRHLVEDCGLGGRRCHRIDEDVMRGKLLAERFRQRDQAGLGRRIVRGVRIALLAGDRGDVHDAPVFLLEHRRHDRLADDEGAVEVDAQNFPPFLEIGLPDRLVDAGDAGIVDEDVDLAERRQRRIARLFNGGGVGDVDLEDSGLAADRLHRFLGQRGVKVPDRNLGAGGGEALGDGAAKALRAAGDDCDAPVEIDLVHARCP